MGMIEFMFSGGVIMTTRGNRVELFHLDAFTDRPFTGNPAAVCLLDQVLPASLMRKIAGEINLSETAFILPIDGDHANATRFRIRWFTPLVEVNLCGHATLATAAAIFMEMGNPAERIFFESKSGPLTASRSTNGFTLDFPSNPPHPCRVPAGILEGLGLTDGKTGWLSEEAEMLLVPLETYEEVRSLSPDYRQLLAVSERNGAQGVIVTAPGPECFDFCSRYFGPWEGINEDPVTGSAHTVLAPYWGSLLGKSCLRALQASERTGIVEARLVAGPRVELTGKVRLVMRGSLFV
jgi:PhzF family phenazine biosynthesis protein